MVWCCVVLCSSRGSDSPAMLEIPSWRFKVLAAIPPTNLDALLTLAASESEYLSNQIQIDNNSHQRSKYFTSILFFSLQELMEGNVTRTYLVTSSKSFMMSLRRAVTSSCKASPCMCRVCSVCICSRTTCSLAFHSACTLARSACIGKW